MDAIWRLGNGGHLLGIKGSGSLSGSDIRVSFVTMGSSDRETIDLVVLDDFSRPQGARGSVLVQRSVLSVDDTWWSVWWGAHPEHAPQGPHTKSGWLESFADETLFVTKITMGGKFQPLRKIEEVSEEVAADDDGSAQFSVFLKRTRASSGVYHAILPPRSIPRTVSSTFETKLVSARRSKTGRLALTWLYEGHLEVHIRFAEVRDREFRRMRAEQVLNLANSVKVSADKSALLEQLAKLPANPEAWTLLNEAIKLIPH
jgi:hypothetical protein